MPDGDDAAPLRPMLCGTLAPVGIATSRNDEGSGEAVPPGLGDGWAVMATGPAGGGVAGGTAAGSTKGVV